MEINLTEGFQSSCFKLAAKEVIDLNGAKSSQIVRRPEKLELFFSENWIRFYFTFKCGKKFTDIQASRKFYVKSSVDKFTSCMSCAKQ